MGKNIKTIAGILVILLVAVAVVVSGGCSTPKVASVPFIPPEYYDCTEILPKDMVEIYMSISYGGGADQIDYLYKDKIFVFKNVKVTEDLIRDLDEGYLWADLVRCSLVSKVDMEQYELGDLIDVVGRNKGFNTDGSVGIGFDQVLVLPAGTVALPADPGSGPVTPGY